MTRLLDSIKFTSLANISFWPKTCDLNVQVYFDLIVLSKTLAAMIDIIFIYCKLNRLSHDNHEITYCYVTVPFKLLELGVFSSNLQILILGSLLNLFMKFIEVYTQ